MEMRLTCLGIDTEITPQGDHYIKVSFGYYLPIGKPQIIGMAKTPLGNMNIQSPALQNNVRLKFVAWFTEEEWRQEQDKFVVQNDYMYVQNGTQITLK